MDCHHKLRTMTILWYVFIQTPVGLFLWKNTNHQLLLINITTVPLLLIWLAKMNNTFSLEQICKTKFFDANLLLRQNKLDLALMFTENKPIDPNFTPKNSKRIRLFWFYIKTIYIDRKKISLWTSFENQKGTKRPQKNSKEHSSVIESAKTLIFVESANHACSRNRKSKFKVVIRMINVKVKDVILLSNIFISS